MYNISITCNSEKQINRIKNLASYENVSINIIDNTKYNKEAERFKYYWSAKLDPFILVEKDGKPIRGFYTEASDAINELINFLNNELDQN